MPQRAIFAVILVGYLLIGALFALRTPAWQAPDEPAHYNYIAQIAEGTPLPIIAMGDWDNDYLESLKANRFADNLTGDIRSIEYEDHQPPLYYWLATPVYALSGGNLTAIRLFSVLLGAGIVALTYAIGREMFTDAVALGAMGLVAFLPQHVAILASVNNDALAWLVVAALLWLLVRYVNDSGIRAWHLGVLVGIGFLTKTTTYFMAGVVLLVILLKTRQIKPVFSAGLAMLPFALFWWGRNIITYGFPDFLGLAAHDVVVVGQLRTAELIAQVGLGDYLGAGVQTTFNSFWGQFGWMAAAMPAWVYPILIVVTLVALAGLVWRLFTRTPETTAKPLHGLILGAMIALTAAMYIYYNTTFVQFQGRYLFTALVPAALLMTLGMDAWRAVLLKRRAWVTAWVFMPLALLDLYLIWRVIPGALSPDFL